EPDGPGWALLRAGVERPLISGAEWKEGELRVSGPFAAPEGAAELVLTDTATGERCTAPVAADGDGFSAVLPTAPDTAPADGRYALSLVLAVDGAAEERPLDIDPALLESLPFAGTTAGRPFALGADGPARPLFTAGPEALPRPRPGSPGPTREGAPSGWPPPRGPRRIARADGGNRRDGAMG